MAFDVSTLPAYVEQRRLPLLVSLVLEGRTLDRMVKQIGIKTSGAINYLATNPVWQEGNSCGFNASGDVTMTQRTINTGHIKINMDFCPDTLLGTWAEYEVAIGAGRERLPFEEEVINDILKVQRVNMEKAIWQGDTASSDFYLQHFDGLLKIAGAEADVIDVAISAGTSAYDAIKSVIEKIPDEIWADRAKVFVSPAVFRRFMQELVEKNYYHYSGAQADAPDEFYFPGTSIAVVSTPGLVGTNKIVATTEDNLYYGTDMVDNIDRFKLWYSDDADLYRLRIEWNAGVQFAFPSMVVLGTIATS